MANNPRQKANQENRCKAGRNHPAVVYYIHTLVLLVELIATGAGDTPLIGGISAAVAVFGTSFACLVVVGKICAITNVTKSRSS